MSKYIYSFMLLIIFPFTSYAYNTVHVHSLNCPRVISVKITVSQLLDGFNSFILKNSNGQPQHLMIKSPLLDIYNSAGVSVYHGSDPAQNSAVLNGLPESILGHKATKLSNQWPNLKEAMAMFPELAQHNLETCVPARYTVYSLRSASGPRGAKQEAAIKRLDSRAPRIAIRVVDIIVTRPEDEL